MRNLKTIYRVMNVLTHQKQVDWKGSSAKYARECLEYFIEMEWCDTIKDEVEQYQHLLQRFNQIYNDKEKVLDTFFDNDPELLQFMFLHSVFDAKPNKDRDWLEWYMIKKIHLSDEAIDKLLHPEPAPQDVLDKLKCFNPVQIGFMMHPITIEYGMWQRLEVESEDEKKRYKILKPIHITYLSWEYAVVTPEVVGVALAQYEDIECDSDYEYKPILEDDLPF